MSFFAQHPYFAQGQGQGQAHQRRSSPFHHPHFATPAQYQAAPQFNFFGGGNDHEYHYDTLAPASAQHQYRSHTPVSLDEEEQAALAHLRSIQRRKEAERVIREEAERERLVRQLEVQQQREREAALIARVQRERERELAIARAQAHAHAQREKEVALARRVRAIEAARQVQAERQRRQQHSQQLAIAEAQARQQAALEQRRRQCARHCAARRAEQGRQTDGAAQSNDEGLEGLNRFLGALFGIQLDADDKEPAASQTPAPAAPVGEKEEEVKVELPATATATAKATAPSTETKSKSAEPTATATPATDAEATGNKVPAAEDKKADFPEAINDLLANFLGLRVEPESKLGQAVSSKVPEGLNDLLGQFGLEFVPDAPAQAEAPAAGPSETKEKKEAASNVTESQPAESSRPRHPFDLSEFLSSNTNGLPPFVRDILSNVELAFKNEREQEEKEVEGKGKGVAEGEKNAATPTETPAAAAPVPVTTTADTAAVEEKKTSADSINQLESIATEIRLVRDSFTFPSELSFSHNTPSAETPAPAALLFNKQNKPYHAQNNKLLQLLLQADGVASNGDREVRRKRKEVVKLVEGELEALENKRDEQWRVVRERRERGDESSDDESNGSWTTGSTVDHEEQQPVHVEDVAAASSTSAPGPETSETTAPTSEANKAEVEVDATPTTFAEAVKSTPDGTQDTAEQIAPTNAPAESKAATVTEEKKENEEGYELL